jgi:tRNA (guanine-N7-)-methyltransferase
VNTAGQQVPFRRTVLSYVQRGERMTVGQQRAWDRHWSALGREVSALPEGPLDIPDWFGRHAPTVLEIGSGMGDATAQLAAAQPEVNYLAVEVYKPGLAQLLLRAEHSDLRNLRLLRGDAVTLLRDHLEAASLTEIRIFFPDPWPKKKHHKRRLVQEETISLIASRLVEGGVLHLATDWEHYAEQMLATCTAEPGLRNRHADARDGWAPRPGWRPMTKFERRARDEGRTIRDLIFERAPLED